MKALLEAIVSLHQTGDKRYVRTYSYVLYLFCAGGVKMHLTVHVWCVLCSVVFSQWTAMLDIVELHLGQSGISFSRIDGT